MPKKKAILIESHDCKFVRMYLKETKWYKMLCFRKGVGLAVQNTIKLLSFTTTSIKTVLVTLNHAKSCTCDSYNILFFFAFVLPSSKNSGTLILAFISYNFIMPYVVSMRYGYMCINMSYTALWYMSNYDMSSIPWYTLIYNVHMVKNVFEFSSHSNPRMYFD